MEIKNLNLENAEKQKDISNNNQIIIEGDQEKNSTSNNFIQKLKDTIAGIVIAISVFIILIPYILFGIFIVMFMGGSPFLPIIVSLVAYSLAVIILILIYKKVENKRGRIIFFIILILMLVFNLFFLSLGYLGKDNLVAPYKNSSISDCDKIKDTKKDILGGTEKDFCYFKVAQRDEDIVICDKIELERTRKDCYWDVSRDKDNLDYCLKAKDKEACYVGYAVKQSWNSKIDGGISTCKMITDKELRKTCCLDISSLQGVDENKRAMCLEEISLEQ